MTIKVVFNRNGKKRTKRYRVFQITEGHRPGTLVLLTNTIRSVIIDLKEVESFEWDKERL